jgi:hypothetical protein
MQYTEFLVDCLKGMAQEHPEPFDWQSACEQVNDPRRKQGKRYSITSIVLLALAAILSNHCSELAIAQWGAAQSEEVKHALGFRNGITPHQSTLQRLFRRLNEDELEAALRWFFLRHFASEHQERGAWALSIDGKAQRGRLKFELEGAFPIHAVSMVDHQTGIVLTQGHVEQTDPQPKQVQTDTPPTSKPRPKTTKSKQNEDKAKKEQDEQKM